MPGHPSDLLSIVNVWDWSTTFFLKTGFEVYCRAMFAVNLPWEVGRAALMFLTKIVER